MTKQLEYLIIYHKEDNDGVFSAAIFYDYIINKLHLKLEDLCFMGEDYNGLSEFQKYNTPEQLHKDFKHIIMTDISFNDPKYMKALYKEFGSDFIWCDHHAPIIKASHENRFDDAPGVRDTTRSAILCVWKYLYDQFDEAYNKKEVPELLRILSAWDSWSYEREGYDQEYVRNVNKGVTFEYDLQLGKVKHVIHELVVKYVDGLPNWEYIEDQLIKDMYDLGKKLNDYDDITMRNIIISAGDFEWKLQNDRKACVIFHQGATSSLHFKYVKDMHPEIQHGIVFKHQANSNWVVSIYNINNEDTFHCGDYCKKMYNGGGHAGAAGCTLTQEQFIKILKKKIF